LSDCFSTKLEVRLIRKKFPNLSAIAYLDEFQAFLMESANMAASSQIEILSHPAEIVEQQTIQKNSSLLLVTIK